MEIPGQFCGEINNLRFFRKYISMDRADKDRLRKIVDLFDQPVAKRAGRWG